MVTVKIVFGAWVVLIEVVKVLDPWTVVESGAAEVDKRVVELERFGVLEAAEVAGSYDVTIGDEFTLVVESRV